jgi:sugar phosphate isomerase/epimerase
MSNAKSLLALQIYSARNFTPLDDQLAIVARNGYTHVETFGPFHDDPAASRKRIEAHGLKVRSAHISPDLVIGETAKAIDIVKALGAQFAIAPYLPPEARPTDAAGWRAIGEKLRAAAEICAPQGVSMAWHNHDFEFRALPDGSLPITHLLGDQGLWEADLAWVARGGGDPAAWIERYRGRLAAVHVKDIAPAGEKTDEDGWADVGTGVLPWAKFWALSVDAGAELFVAEHDNPSSFERFARVSAEAMRKFANGAA